MNYCALASGSNGNCYYIGNATDAILIDVGIHAKHVELRMANLGISPASIAAIFITHEHTDHIRGLAVFCKRYQIPVYITEGSYRGARLQLPDNLICIIQPDDVIQIGSLSVVGIPKHHDALEPCSFLVSDGDLNIGVLTDIGRICDGVKHVIKDADVLLLESNYDDELLDAGSYPFFLKNRIRGGLGHLSNHLALETFLAYRTSRLRHLILVHLSGQNNKPDLVKKAFTPYCRQIKLSIASRDKETEMFDSTTLGSVTASKNVFEQVSFQTSFVFPGDQAD